MRIAAGSSRPQLLVGVAGFIDPAATRDCYGSFHGYANDIGLSGAVVHRLEGGLLEPDPA